jgi:hypothetical protein
MNKIIEFALKLVWCAVIGLCGFLLGWLIRAKKERSMFEGIEEDINAEKVH